MWVCYGRWPQAEGSGGGVRYRENKIVFRRGGLLV
jgi:hypothetical protein